MHTGGSEGARRRGGCARIPVQHRVATLAERVPRILPCAALVAYQDPLLFSAVSECPTGGHVCGVLSTGVTWTVYGMWAGRAAATRLSSRYSSAVVGAGRRMATCRRGRGSQSRTFISPVGKGNTDVTGKILTTAYAAILQTAFDDLMTGVLADLTTDAGGVWEMAQLSKKGTGAVYPITTNLVQPALSTQRRRQRR